MVMPSQTSLRHSRRARRTGWRRFMNMTLNIKMTTFDRIREDSQEVLDSDKQIWICESCSFTSFLVQIINIQNTPANHIYEPTMIRL